MDIEGLGDKMVGLLLEHGLVTSLQSVYDLRVAQLEQLPRMGKVSSSNLIEAIEASKHRSLDRFIFALGIRHVGTKTAMLIARAAQTVQKFLSLTEEALVEIPEIGPETAKSVATFLADDEEVAEVMNSLSAIGPHGALQTRPTGLTERAARAR